MIRYTETEEYKNKIALNVESVLTHGPFKKGDKVTYHGLLFDIPETAVGDIRIIDEDENGALVSFPGTRRTISCCRINLRHAKEEP